MGALVGRSGQGGQRGRAGKEEPAKGRQDAQARRGFASLRLLGCWLTLSKPAPSDNVQAHHESPPFADAFLTDKRFIACATASTVSTLAAATWKRAQHAAVTEDLPHGHSESELPAHLQSFEAFIAHCKSVGRQAGCCVGHAILPCRTELTKTLAQVYDCPTATETIYTPFLPLPHPFDQTLWLCERHSRLYFVWYASRLSFGVGS